MRFSSGSVLSEALAEGNHPKITASGLGSHRVQFSPSSKAAALFICSVLTLLLSKAFLLNFCLFSEDLRLWRGSAGPMIFLPPSGKVVGELFTTFLFPLICFLHSCFHCVSSACFQHHVTWGQAAHSWNPSWGSGSHRRLFGPNERDQRPLQWGSSWELSVLPDSPAFLLLSLPAGPSRTGCDERSVPALPWKAVTRLSSLGRTMGAASLSTSNGLISTAPTSLTQPAAWSSPRPRAAAPWTA